MQYHHAFEVGQRVRIFSIDSTSSRTGMVCSVNDEGTYDVFYDTNDRKIQIEGEEESCVIPSRIRPLEGFELSDMNRFTIAELKAHGNILFGLKDYNNASRYYQFALDKSSSMYEVILGCSVIVLEHPDLPKGQTCIDGMIADADVDSYGKELYEVILSDGNEISNVKRTHVLALPQDRENLLLLRSIYLNMARCDMKRNRKGWTIHHASIAVSISQIIQSDLRDKGSAETDDADQSKEILETDQLLTDALYFRAKSFLTAARPGLATKDLKVLQHFDKSKRISQLIVDIDNFRIRRVKENQRLAKDIAQWVDDVMSGKAKETDMQTVADIDIGDDCDDEGATAATAKSFSLSHAPDTYFSSTHSSTIQKSAKMKSEIKSPSIMVNEGSSQSSETYMQSIQSDSRQSTRSKQSMLPWQIAVLLPILLVSVYILWRQEKV